MLNEKNVRDPESREWIFWLLRLEVEARAADHSRHTSIATGDRGSIPFRFEVIQGSPTGMRTANQMRPEPSLSTVPPVGGGRGAAITRLSRLGPRLYCRPPQFGAYERRSARVFNC